MRLADIIAPMDTDEFFAEYWPERQFSVQKNENRQSALLAEVPELESAERLLASYPAEVRLLNSENFHASVPSGPHALPFYRKGFTCYLPMLHRQIPALEETRRAVADELGMPRQNVVAEVFCSTGTSGVSMHSDYDVNFAMLVHGDKTWRIAPNETVENPIIMCLPKGRAQRDSRQLEWSAGAPLPDRMPDDTIDVPLRPGGVAFVPRGWWHETYANGDCLQVNVAVKGPMWLSVLADGLTNTLVPDARWRAFPFGIAGRRAAHETALAQLAELVEDLRERLGAGTAEDVARQLIAAAGLGPSAETR